LLNEMSAAGSIKRARRSLSQARTLATELNNKADRKLKTDWKKHLDDSRDDRS